MARQPHATLVQSGRLLPAAVNAAREKASRIGMSLEYVLRTEHGLSAEELGASLAAQHRAEFVAYREGLFSLADALPKLPVDQWWKLRAAPVAHDGRKIVVLMADPGNLPARDQLEQALGAPVVAKVAFEEDIHRLLVGSEPKPRSENELHLAAPPRDTVVAGESPAVSLGNQLLLQAVNVNASEIRLNPLENPSVTIRIGDASKSLPLRPEQVTQLIRRFKVMASLDPTNPSKPHAGRFTLAKGQGGFGVQIATTPLGDGLESAVLHLLKG